MTSVRSQALAEAAVSKPPYIEDKLLDYLESVYQDRSPEPDETEREIWMNRGAVGVIRHLRRIFEEQRENMMEIS